MPLRYAEQGGLTLGIARPYRQLTEEKTLCALYDRGAITGELVALPTNVATAHPLALGRDAMVPPRSDLVLSAMQSWESSKAM